MKVITTACHSDEVSGCTTFDDGTRAFWTEGRSSSVEVIRPDGTRYSVDCRSIDDDPVMEALGGDDYGEVRQMTEDEEREIARVRGWEER